MKLSAIHIPKSAFNSGFTLIEMVIYIALLSIIMIGVYSLYISQQRQGLVQEDVVEVQQNLRVAMDSITRDIRMAGFLVGTNNPVQNAGDNDPDTITLYAASASNVSARIDQNDLTINVLLGTNITFTVDSSEAVDAFTIGDIVRIISPQTQSQPLNATFQVTGQDSGNKTITLTYNSGSTGIVIFKRGDAIARIDFAGAESYPGTIAYAVVNGSIEKDINGTGGQVVASNITDLQFRYILDGGNEVNSPTDLSQVRAIRVTIDGITSLTGTALGGSAQKIRELTTIVKIRNR